MIFNFLHILSLLHTCTFFIISTRQRVQADFEKTFSSIAKTTISSLIVVAMVRHWPMFQLDFKNAFLNGDLEEMVYML